MCLFAVQELACVAFLLPMTTAIWEHVQSLVEDVVYWSGAQLQITKGRLVWFLLLDIVVVAAIIAYANKISSAAIDRESVALASAGSYRRPREEFQSQGLCLEGTEWKPEVVENCACTRVCSSFIHNRNSDNNQTSFCTSASQLLPSSE
jgi:hypothetical protein